MGVILAAGYGTRLAADLQGDNTGLWDHIKDCPKPLLPLGNISLLTRWTTALHELKEVEHICVITNDKFYQQFVTWKTNLGDEELEKKIILYNDFSTCNADRLGAVTDLHQASQILPSGPNLLVIAGDTIFRQEFSLECFFHKLRDIQSRDKTASLICHTECPENAVRKHGIVEIDQEMRVTRFLEKPNPSETTSRFQCPCFYLLSAAALELLPTFLDFHQSSPLEEKDATGKFVKFLVTRMPVFSYQVLGRFDLGNLQSYTEANKYFSCTVQL